jgi:subtilisin family serine protease
MRTTAARIFVMLALTVGLAALPLVSGASATAKPEISQLVLRNTANGKTTKFMVVLKARADLTAARALKTKEAKGRFVFDTMTALAARTQAPLKAALDAVGATYRSHWALNALVVTGGRRAVDAMASRGDVARIEAVRMIKSTVLSVGDPVASPQAGPQAIEWNISRVKAPQVWSHGFFGQGVVVGDIDTGQQWDHPAIKNQYRGWNGSTADFNYNWFDLIAGSPTPMDPAGHGTHTAGIIVGDDGGSNQIGVAPQAKWFSCRSMDATGFGSEDTYVGCLEFMLAPYDLSGNNPDPSKAPSVISDSWNCLVPDEGCTQDSLLAPIVALRAAGIVPVFSAGNDGPGCRTVGSGGPPAQYDQVYAVGSSNISNALSFFSSRGPAKFQGTRVKPDIVAPGEGIRSSYPNNTYAVLSGTSMAAPHIAGVIALMYSANPALVGNVDQTEANINNTARHINSSECQSNGTFPNNLWGYGFVDASRAVRP